MHNQLLQLRRYLQLRRNLWACIASETKLTRRWLQFIANDPRRDVRYSTVHTLLTWAEKNDPEGLAASDTRAGSRAGSVLLAGSDWPTPAKKQAPVRNRLK